MSATLQLPPSKHSLSPPSPLVEERPTSQSNKADVLIVGAGILGCALAVTFARQGRSVVLLEKSLKEPDRIVGELLQPGGVQALKELGLRHCLEEIDAIPVKGFGVFYYDEKVEMPYTSESDSTDNPSLEGRSFHHGRFIRRLREACICEPNVSVVETTVTSTITSPTTKRILGVETMRPTEKPYNYYASLNVIADGYASKFRKQHHPHAVTTKSRFWGVELIDAELPFPLHGHVILGDGSPILLYQIGTHETRALIDVPANLASGSLAEGGIQSYLRTRVTPALPRSVQSSFTTALEKGKLRSMPNSFLPPSTNTTPGLVMLGDAMNMRHPLTGGGMTVAFNDVVLLRELLSPSIVPDLTDTSTVLKQMSRFHWRRKNLTGIINISAQGLYPLFAADGKRDSLAPSSSRSSTLIHHRNQIPTSALFKKAVSATSNSGAATLPV
ncbi:hypothetical protein IMSHALPRED_011071 [Imshaugia aleurites]|uniref:Squalene monooxygenase n=1 Tax=Imshaugia aleurites TaxID=172621 RepID=A0A8H3G653_9LECA|nr:hypothetical protein IMSHALPRED_011071 [Imshaugia aleurites]